MASLFTCLQIQVMVLISHLLIVTYLIGLSVMMTQGNDCQSKDESTTGCFVRANYTESLGWIAADEIHTYNMTGWSSLYCDVWFLIGLPGQIITISSEKLDIFDPGARCNETFLELGNEPCRSWCSSNQISQLSYISKGNIVRVKYQRRGQIGGFRLKYVMGHVPADEPCLNTDFQCGNGKCIPAPWRCNQQPECEDLSDERGCPAVTTPATLSELEWSCGVGLFGCHSTVYNRYHCFLDNQLCDDVKDCTDGRDEKNCPNNVVVIVVCRQSFNEESAGAIFKFPSSTLLSSPASFNVSQTMRAFDCEYFVQVQVNKKIQIRFVSLSITRLAVRLAAAKEEETFEIYDGPTAEGSQLLFKSSTSSPYSSSLPLNKKIIESKTNYLYMKFHTVAQSMSYFNVTYQAKGVCLPNQQSCTGEEDCYDATFRCDGRWDCRQHGIDEAYCDGCAGYSCGSDHPCYSEADRCNGRARCLTSFADEHDCTEEQCGPHNGTFLCSNGHCIHESWKCDGTNDCQDLSDELHCPLSNRVILAAVIASLSCVLILVIALGCTCRLYARHIRLMNRSGGGGYDGRHMSPITEIERHIFLQRSAPPAYPEAMATSRPYEDVRREEMLVRHSTGSVGGSATFSNCCTSRGEAPPPPYDNTTITVIAPAPRRLFEPPVAATAAATTFIAAPVTVEPDRESLNVTIVSTSAGIASSLLPRENHKIDDDDDDELLDPMSCGSNLTVIRSSGTDTCDGGHVALSLVTGLLPQAQWRKAKSSGSQSAVDNDHICLIDYQENPTAVATGLSTDISSCPRISASGSSDVAGMLEVLRSDNALEFEDSESINVDITSAGEEDTQSNASMSNDTESLIR